MKKLLVTIVFFGLLFLKNAAGAASFSAGTDSIPAIYKKLNTLFPAVTGVNYQQVGDCVQASFKTDGVASRAIFGKRYQFNYQHTHFSKEKTPVQVANYIRRKYRGYSIKNVSESWDGYTRSYWILLEGEKNYQLIMMENGRSESVQQVSKLQ